MGNFGYGLAALFVLLLPLVPVPEFVITQMNYIGIDALVVVGLVLLTGVCGLTSFGQAAFVGVGAYATAYVTTALGWSPWIGLGVGLLLTAAIALVLGFVTLRMSGHNLPLATIAWCIALYYVLGNLDALGRYDGLVNVPSVSIAGFSLQSGRHYYYLIWITAGLAAFGSLRLLDSRTGRVLRAMNPDHGGGSTMPEAMGASVFRHKLLAFLIAALLASIAGWLFAHLQRTVNPSPFGIGRSLDYLFMAVLGGVGYVWGAFVGAAFTTILKDVLQDWLPKLFGGSGNYETVVFGILLIAVLKLSPGGLWSLVGSRFATKRTELGPSGNATLQLRIKPQAGDRLLDVVGIHKQFGGLAAVQDISFSVSAGEIVGLIGPNGAGKSTTFNLISGVLALSKGEVRFSGRKIDGVPSRHIARLGLSRTFQHVKLIPEMSVIENVALGCYLRTRSGALAAVMRTDRREERMALAEAEKQLARIGLGDVPFEQAGNLSLGAQRLVEIARALATDPTLLLLDEPAAGLRHAEKVALSNVLARLKQEGLSLLLVEHDMNFVMGLADRIVVMEFGRKLIEGTPAVVQASPIVRAAYLGVEH
ncbi:branched-chain amino acid ABC transporter ATP-binding protein/permease [Bradyrhizobium liaoningense]|uniref:branched-chain amino acid ABC transporter ATP-binding protein/permease n=1 Tax=Bradyrhizobium liaoningense TaxID=43992 RepID=UPI001BA5B52D|nr:branched-chain amino acid ABC transporter ATP-binding protein/permease [Bradyrhizobium liaoningense]MBR0706960.1 branched-chain amino acid ABC transporter ATP-binding protein/permease [Bradyrhizobium liaoningense]